jgi:hypothetical protein
MKRPLAIALLLACAPAVHAFPPCPNGGQMIPGPARVESSDWEPWRVTYYDFAGDPDLIKQLTATRAFDSTNGGGQCRPRAVLPVRANRPDALIRPYAPRVGFGVLTLPDMPSVAQPGLGVRNTLYLRIDNTPLPKDTNWVDFLIMDFRAMNTMYAPHKDAPTTIYRLRKAAIDKTRSTIEVWESRAAAASELPRGAQWARTDTLVAAIPISSPAGDTDLWLRWTQQVGGLQVGTLNIQSQLEVISSHEKPPIHTAVLPGEWASMVSLGLIDYVMNDPNTGTDQNVLIDGQSLTTELVSEPK